MKLANKDLHSIKPTIIIRESLQKFVARQSPPLPDVATAPTADAWPPPGADVEVAATVASAGLVLATTCFFAGGAAASEVPPATCSVTGEPYSAAHLVSNSAALRFRGGAARQRALRI